MDTNIFEQATRAQVRFPSGKGLLTVEDLWELPLTSKNGTDLDNTAKLVNSRLKASQEESFVKPKSNPERASLELQLEIVKHIIAVRLREDQERLARAGRRAEKDRLVAILETKQIEKMQGMTEEQIQARIAELEQ